MRSEAWTNDGMLWCFTSVCWILLETTEFFHLSPFLPAAFWKEEMASSRPPMVCLLLRVPTWEYRAAMLKRMLAFSSDRFCWHTGTPVNESYLWETRTSCHWLFKTLHTKLNKSLATTHIRTTTTTTTIFIKGPLYWINCNFFFFWSWLYIFSFPLRIEISSINHYNIFCTYC